MASRRKVIYICDRCGAEASGTGPKGNTRPEGWGNINGKTDLCVDCGDSFDRWLKDGDVFSSPQVTPEDAQELLALTVPEK